MGKFKKADNGVIEKLKLLFNKFICLHDWNLLDRKVSESKIEQMLKLGARSNKVPQSMMEKKYIQIWVCKKCGKLKRFVDEL